MIDEAMDLAAKGQFKEAAAMVKHLVEAGADRKGTHVNLAHIVVMAADWSLINALLPALACYCDRKTHYYLKTVSPRRSQRAPRITIH